MKVLLQIAPFITVSVFLLSCGNTIQKRIVSEVPIKTEVLGLKLCDRSSERSIEEAITKAMDKTVLTNSENSGVGTNVRVFPVSLNLNYGGLSWHYIDVMLNEDKMIVAISIVSSYESYESAKEQYIVAAQIFTRKYGKGNQREESQNVFWTDDTNSVGLICEESSAIYGNDRSFCTLYYVNIELWDVLEKANQPDV